MKFKVKSDDMIFFGLKEMDEGLHFVCSKEEGDELVFHSIGIIDKHGFTASPGLPINIGFAVDDKGRIRFNGEAVKKK